MSTSSPTSGPPLADALHLFRGGRLQEAEALVARIVEGTAGSGDGLALAGLIAYERGDFEAAHAWHARAVATHPREPLYLCNLATTFVARGLPEEAESIYDRALELRPGFIEAVIGKAALLERRGDGDRACAALADLVSAPDPPPRAVVTYARALVHGGNAAELVERSPRLIGRASLDDASRRSVLFALGQAHDRLGAYDEAFAVFEAANRLATVPFDLSRHAGKLRTIRSQFAADTLASIPRSTCRSRVPVFIVGLPRAGSTLIEQILHRHPQAAGGGERQDMALTLQVMPTVTGSRHAYPFCVGELSARELGCLGAAYVTRLQRAAAIPVRRIVDKTLINFERLGIIARMLPCARVIHARRDPRDQCLSCFMQDLPPRLHPYSTDLVQLGLCYREYERMMDHWRAVAIDMLEIDYERLVARPTEEIPRLLEYVGLDVDDRCLRPERSRRGVATASYHQVQQPIGTGAVRRHERYAAHLGPLYDVLTAGR